MSRLREHEAGAQQVVEAKLDLAVLLQVQGPLYAAEAECLLKEVVSALDPSSPRALQARMNLANLLLDKGDEDGAGQLHNDCASRAKPCVAK